MLPIEQESRTRARHSSTVWQRSQSDPVCHDNYRLDEVFSSYKSTSRRDNFTPTYVESDVHVTVLENGVLIGGHGLVIDYSFPTLSTQRSSFINESRLHSQWSTLRCVDMPEGITYLVGANNVYCNHYHWMFQCLPSVMLLRQVAREKGLDYRIVLPLLDRRHKRSLELLGVKHEECVTLLEGQFISRVPLMYTSAMSGRYMFQPSARLIALLDPYREACLRISGNKNLPKRFYVSRRDAAQRRSLTNEVELSRALQKHGYTLILLSELSLEDQTAVFAGAESIVAPHGAGLVNLMFAGSNARLLEIMPEQYRSAHYFRLSQCRGMAYDEVCAQAVDIENPCIHGSVQVSIDKVLEVLKYPKATDNDQAA